MYINVAAGNSANAFGVLTNLCYYSHDPKCFNIDTKSVVVQAIRPL